MSLAAHDSEFRRWSGGVDRRICQTLAASPAEPGELPLGFSNLRQELQNLGWAEGRNLRIEFRWGALNTESRRQFAKELIAMKPDVIFSQNTPTTATLHQQTQTVPIVFVLVSDPIGSGFVTSFPRPGGNITGFIAMEATVAGKWLGLLKEIAPHITRVIFLFNPTTAPYFELYLNPLKAAAQSYGVEVIMAPVKDASELETVIALNAREPNGGLIAMSDAFLNVHREKVTSLAARYRLPAIYPYHYFFDVGGLMFYGPEMVDQYRRAASYINRILKGEKPAELPVQAPTKYELAIIALRARPRRRGDRIERNLLRCICRLLADFVAKVFLHSRSKFLLAVHATFV
jgi:putative ABC transport system substrate-binding protein